MVYGEQKTDHDRKSFYCNFGFGPALLQRFEDETEDSVRQSSRPAGELWEDRRTRNRRIEAGETGRDYLSGFLDQCFFGNGYPAKPVNQRGVPFIRKVPRQYEFEKACRPSLAKKFRRKKLSLQEFGVTAATTPASNRGPTADRGDQAGPRSGMSSEATVGGCERAEGALPVFW